MNTLEQDSPLADLALLIGRVALVVIFAVSGWEKLGNLNGFAANLAERGLPISDFLAFGAAVLEVGGAILIAVGALSRLTSLALLGFTILATLIAHGFWAFDEPDRGRQATQFFKNLGLMGGLVYIAAVGPGRFSVDRLWSRQSSNGNAVPPRGAA